MRPSKRGSRFWRASFLALGAITAGAWLAVTAIAIADRRALRRAPRVFEDDGTEPVTMVVPARNEARHIGRWIDEARRQRVRLLRIVVVDDESSDATLANAVAAAAQDPRVDVRSAGPLPPGWIGKTWAAHVGSRDVATGWLLFSDADVELDPAALPSALAAARSSHADALSFTTTLLCKTFWERQIMPAIAAIIFSAIPAWATSSERLPIGLLAGGFLLVRVQAYRLAGGHAAVRASIAEDRDLAERLKAFGYRVRLMDGSALVRVRMYEGLREMWNGWRKNFYEGVRRSPLAAAFAVAGFAAMLVIPLPLLVTLAAKRLVRTLDADERALAALASTSVAATTLVRILRDPAIGVKTEALSVLCTPLAGLFAASVMAASAWRIVSGRGQVWKDRIIR
jgi:cellulose synthase/poly-beta-1,6-N-acetylglucosamine synthase-like glycosyltransferase